jgi:hypothetical protein
MSGFVDWPSKGVGASRDPNATAGCAPPSPATHLPSWACPASRSFRVACLAAFWFAAPSLPFLRLRGVRRATPSGAMAPAAPSGLSDPPRFDPAAFADAREARRLPSWGCAPLQRSRPAGVRSTRWFRPPAPSALGVSHALDGLLLRQAPGPFQAGAAPGVLPSELPSSPGSRTPHGAVALLLFRVTAVLHSEVFLEDHGSPQLQSLAPPDKSAPRGAAAPLTGRCSPGIQPLQGSHRNAMACASAGLPARTSASPHLAKDGASPVPPGFALRSGQGVRLRTPGPLEVFHLIPP